VEIVIDSLLEGARRARGVVIIVDVLRAYTTAAVALSRGASKIVLVAEVEEALALRSDGVGELCMGEVGGMRPEGFDFGNSPSQLSRADVQGKTIIQSTRAGTVGMNAAEEADQLYGGSFAVASATVEAIRRHAPLLVTIVAMGSEGRIRTDEDEQCALYLRNLLLGVTPDHDSVRSLMLAGSEARKYGNPATPHFPVEDRDMAATIDSHNFAIRVTKEQGLLVARKESA
jgi:2-phosphosulfolactate phosphatase